MADLFAGRFFSSFVILTLLFLIISGIKKLLEKTLSSQVHYLLWMPFLISLAVPFLPACLWDKGSWYALLNFTADSARAKVETGFSHSDLFPLSSSLTGIQDCLGLTSETSFVINLLEVMGTDTLNCQSPLSFYPYFTPTDYFSFNKIPLYPAYSFRFSLNLQERAYKYQPFLL